MAISEESLTNMLSAMGREIGNAIATANTAAQNAAATPQFIPWGSAEM